MTGLTNLGWSYKFDEVWLVPFCPVVQRRQLGGWQGRVVIHDDFDELPADVAAAFAGHTP